MRVRLGLPLSIVFRFRFWWWSHFAENMQLATGMQVPFEYRTVFGGGVEETGIFGSDRGCDRETVSACL